MNKLARFTTRRHWLVIAGWLAFVLLAQGISVGLGGADYKDSFSLPHTETAKVTSLLKQSGQSGQSGISGTMVLKAKTGSLTTPAPGVLPALQKLCGSNLQVNGATTPWGSIACKTPGTVTPLKLTGANPLLSENKQLGLVTINWEQGQFSQNLFTDAYDQLKTVRSDQLQVEFTGDAFQGLGEQQGGIPPVLLGFIAALIVLALFFRALLATILPLISAVAALSGGLGLIGMLTHVMDVSNVTPQLAELMVIGVGVDYALFLVTRHRRNLLAGMTMDDSIALAVNTSGRAVVFAGGTVCIAMLGLAVLGVSFFYGVAIGTAIGVSLTVLASLTLTPALLSFFGLRVLPRSQRKAVRDGTYVAPERVAFWMRWARIVADRKIILGAAALAVIVALSIPFFSIRSVTPTRATTPRARRRAPAST